MAYRTDRYLTARDLAERLLPDLKMNEILLWSPDLFAFTSYILSHTGVYQLVISPPRGKRWYPRNQEINKWFDADKVEKNLDLWLKTVFTEWNHADLSSEETRKEITETKKNLLKQFQDELDKELEIKVIKDGKEDDTVEKKPLKKWLDVNSGSGWKELVKAISDDWRTNISKVMNESDLKIIDDADKKIVDDKDKSEPNAKREKKLFQILLKYTPRLLIVLWATFHNEVNDITEETISKPHEERNPIAISDLLCNEEGDIDDDKWKIAELLLTMHAISDVTCLGWGIRSSESGEKNAFQAYAEGLLFSKGSLSTINPQRCRVMPKRHNPELGITLRSVSSNLAFHRSSVDVVWRKAKNNPLVKRLSKKDKKERKKKISILLIPYPFNIETKDFREDKANEENKVLDFANENYGFFEYKPSSADNDIIKKIIAKANDEISSSSDDIDINPKNVDIVIFPETALDTTQEKGLMETLEENGKRGEITSIVVAGVREKKNDNENFSKNVVYCKYYNDKKNTKEYTESGETKTVAFPIGYGDLENNLVKFKNNNPKYKQHKHHRWKLTESQIKQFGLSLVLDHKKIWWESTKVPRRRVSFLNVGDEITICSLICEDLARQDPIADLIRHVGPSLVITILMDGPQSRNRWASRYATVLSDDPGSSVITLTAYGMVRRYSSPYNEMSRVVAMWSEKDRIAREIELAQGAKGILLTIEVENEKERTADGREETVPTSVLRLLDVIQIYPD